jgi:hypothetical protein
MTPKRINFIGFYIVFTVRWAMFLLAIYMGYRHHYFGAILTWITAICFRWKMDGSWVPKG